MPPATPSPHRFLPGQCRPSSPAKDARQHKPRSRQQQRDEHRHGVPGEIPPSSSQFSRTPRFTSGRPAQAIQTQLLPEQSLAHALQVSIRQPEDVEETRSPDNEDDEMPDETADAEVLPTTEIMYQEIDRNFWTGELPNSPKRRRLDDFRIGNATHPLSDSLARPVFKQPTTSASQLRQQTPHFARSGSIDRGDSTARRRPAFLPSSVAPSEPSEPLPEAFSPHRRGQKFVPGGMAATVQQWVIETGQSAAQSRRSQSHSRGEDYILRMKVDECKSSGGAQYTVLGRLPGRTEAKVLLAGNKGSADTDVGVLSAGAVVGIRVPIWEVDIDGESWTVGVDWKLLS